MRQLRSVAASYDTQAFIPAPRAPEPAPAAAEAEAQAQADDAGTGAAEEEAEENAEENADAEAAARVGDSDRPSSAPRRLRDRLLLAAGVACLAAVGTLVVPRWPGGADPAPAGARPSASASFAGWESAPVSGAGGAVCGYGAERLLCAWDGVVLALDPDDGTRLWRRSVAGRSRSGPPAVAGGLVQPALDEGAALTAFDPVTGGPAWRREGPEYRGLRPVGGMLLVTGADGGVTG
ncbi:PQQ-like beta-propeller repeat protein, partial [Streptomyces sp. TRM76130]|nr:PQQ-like beta-propeller repeat protein [Streptomyces sp. TRM76130]